MQDSHHSPQTLVAPTTPQAYCSGVRTVGDGKIGQPQAGHNAPNDHHNLEKENPAW